MTYHPKIQPLIPPFYSQTWTTFIADKILSPVVRLQLVKSRPTPWDIHDPLVGMDLARHTRFLHHPECLDTFSHLASASMDLHQTHDWNCPPPQN